MEQTRDKNKSGFLPAFVVILFSAAICAIAGWFLFSMAWAWIAERF